MTEAGASTPIRQVLFVCTGNICRSAYAEVRARALRSDAASPQFLSGGTHGLSQSPMESLMSAQAEQRGTSTADFRSQPVRADLVQRADLVVAMTDEHRSWIIDEYPAAHTRTVLLGQLAAAAAQAPPELRGAEFVATARRLRGARDEWEVADPYHRGGAAAAACAAQLDQLLALVLPRL